MTEMEIDRVTDVIDSLTGSRITGKPPMAKSA